MIELTLEQRNAMAQNSETPPRVLDPDTNTGYVLFRAEVYDRIRQIFDLGDDQLTRDLTPHVMEVFGRDGWDDPAMDVYNELDPRGNP
jgi:hypothetical protein